MIRMNASVTALDFQPGMRRRGQTLVIALIMLGVILLLGFVFLGILSHNINSGKGFQKRSVSQELAEAGLRYAHSQMLTGTLGADWRGLPTPPYAVPIAASTPVVSRDPDAMYLRIGTNLPVTVGSNQIDAGGPDGLGFYTRVNFSNGRALVRVRYAPSDANVFAASASGNLPAPGRARSYVIIESVGRQGVINPNDPTTMNATPVTLGTTNGTGSSDGVNNIVWANPATVIPTLADTEKSIPTSQKQVGFVSIGIIDSALYVTNRDMGSRPADIGSATDNGATSVDFNGTNYQVDPVLPVTQYGGLQTMYTLSNNPIQVPNVPGFGGIWVNGDLVMNGTINAYENYTLGDAINVTGTITAADSNAKLNLVRAEYEQNRPGYPATWYGGEPAIKAIGWADTFPSNLLNSRGSFSTYGEVLRDGLPGVDATGFRRGVARKEPPSMEQRDPSNGALRYVTLTRESGSYVGTGNSGRFGYGSGVYVDNFDDIQIPRDDVARAAVGGEESLIYDWLNPNNGQPNSGWTGPFYSPIAAYLQLMPDGFIITRDAPKGNYGQWLNPDGSTPVASTSSLRFRVGYASDGQVHIVNALTPGIASINGTLINTDFDKGPIFNGVLYFEGNVRVRGIIATDVQFTVVSGATIYIEGSIVRGVVGNDVNTSVNPGRLINTPSKSSIMLMARDYVTVNPTQFFGPGPGTKSTGYDFPNNIPTPDGVYPIRAQSVGDNFTLEHEFLLNPDTAGGNVYNPQTWLPYDGNYTTILGAKVPTLLMLSHSADTGSAAETFLSVNVNTGLPTSPFLFNLTPNNGASVLLPAGYIEPGYTNAGWASVYGLGTEAQQRFPQFETAGFQLIDNADFTYTAGSPSLLTGQSSNKSGTYSIQEEATNDITFRVTSIGGQSAAAYMMGQAAIVPADVRIEASVFAEEGSFFVIPGNWFNPNSADTRLAWLTKVQENLGNGLNQAQANAAADLYRLNSYGSFPEAPFYGEPIDVKITIFGAVSENMTPTISQQAEYQRKWGWIPTQQGSPSLGVTIPGTHQGAAGSPYGPNLTIIYDATLATGRVEGFAPTNNLVTDPYLRTDNYGRPLAPMPRLPVGPVLAYFGEQS